jgi:hypothetical protein
MLPRIHTWTFVAKNDLGLPITVRAYLAEPPLVPDLHEYTTSTTPVLVTDDGEAVFRLAQGIYKLVKNGAVIASLDPDAP